LRSRGSERPPRFAAQPRAHRKRANSSSGSGSSSSSGAASGGCRRWMDNARSSVARRAQAAWNTPGAGVSAAATLRVRLAAWPHKALRSLPRWRRRLARLRGHSGAVQSTAPAAATAAAVPPHATGACGGGSRLPACARSAAAAHCARAARWSGGDVNGA
jgi:hypothetical protein